MGGVFSDHQNKGLNGHTPVLAGVQVEGSAGLLVQVDAIHQLDAVLLSVIVVFRLKIFAGSYSRLFYEAVADGFGEAVFIDDVLELDRSAPGDYLWRSGEFKPKNGVEFVEHLHAAFGTVVVAFVHDHHQVGQAGEVVEIALAQVFGHFADVGRGAALLLAVDLGDVEHVDVQVGAEQATGGVLPVVVAGNHVGLTFNGAADEALKDVLLSVGLGEVLDQLVIDGEVGRQHEEVLNAVLLVKVADESPGQAGFTNSGGEAETEGREIALEVFEHPTVRLHFSEFLAQEGGVGLAFGEGQVGADGGQQFEALPLGGA